MNWDQLVEGLKGFFDRPIVISLSAILTAGVFALVIFAKTSLGKKLFNQLKDSFAEASKKAEEAKLQSSLEVEAKKAEIEELRGIYEGKLSVLLEENLALEECLGKIGEAMPNARVKAAINDFLSSKGERLERIKEAVGGYAETIGLKEEVETLEKQLVEQRESLEALYDEKLRMMTDMFERLTEGKHEEGTEPNPAEEEIQKDF